MSLTRRLQILLDEERYARVAAVAEQRKVSVATVVREAIDRGLPSAAGQRVAAAHRLLAAPAMEVPSVDGLVHELDDVRGRRG